eukprot:4301631-Prymnesium_polylepis.1
MRSLPLLLTIANGFAATVPEGSIICGDAKGETAHNWFNDVKCGSYLEGMYGAACWDDFNVWCCPHNYGCRGSFADPGGNNHCQTLDHKSADCTYCPNRPDKKILGHLGVCLNTAAWGQCPKQRALASGFSCIATVPAPPCGLLMPSACVVAGDDYSLQMDDFVVPDDESRCKFFCCPHKGQYCLDAGCIPPASNEVASAAAEETGSSVESR